jgi:hypothetical protein
MLVRCQPTSALMRPSAFDGATTPCAVAPCEHDALFPETHRIQPDIHSLIHIARTSFTSYQQSQEKRELLRAADYALQAVGCAVNDPSLIHDGFRHLVIILSRWSVHHPALELLGNAIRDWSMGQGSWEAVSTAYHPIKIYCDQACNFLASTHLSPEVIPALAEHRSICETIERVRGEIAAADSSRSFLSSLISKLKGNSPADVSAVQLESERFLLHKRSEWLRNFGSLMCAVDTRALAQMHGHYPSDTPLASYEELSTWMGLWQELHRSHPPDGPIFRKVSWADEWSRFRNNWLPLESLLPSKENAPQIVHQRSDAETAPPLPQAAATSPRTTILASEIERGLRAILPEHLAIQVKAAFLQSHFFSNCEEREILSLLEQISEWNRDLRKRVGQSYQNDRSELLAIAQPLIEPYNGVQFASDSELATIRVALEPQALWLQQRELAHILTAAYARRLLRVLPRDPSLRSSSLKVQTPIFTEPADPYAPTDSDVSIEHRLARLSEAYQQLYPGMQIIYTGNRGHVGEFLVYQPANQVITSADDLGKNRAFMGDPASELEGLLPRMLQQLLDGNNSDSPSSIDLHYTNIHPEPIAEPAPAPAFDLDDFLAGLEAVYERALQSGPHLLSDSEDAKPLYRSVRPTYENIYTPLTDVPSLRLCRDPAYGLLAHTEHGSFAIRNGEPIPRSDVLSPEDTEWSPGASPIQITTDECFGIQRLVLDHCERFFIPSEGPLTLSHGTVVLHLDGLAGTDELRDIRLRIMAETVARFDRHTAVVLQGSEESIESFERSYLSISNPYNNKAPIFTDSIGVPNLERAIHIVALDGEPSLSNFQSNRVVPFETTTSGPNYEFATIPLYAPRFFFAQSESRIKAS